MLPTPGIFNDYRIGCSFATAHMSQIWTARRTVRFDTKRAKPGKRGRALVLK
jgi:hypothetical protein